MSGLPWDVEALGVLVRERTIGDDPLDLLECAVHVAAQAGEVGDALVERFVAAARGAGLSWTVIGDRLGVSKQAARQRFADRLGQRDVPAGSEGVVVDPRLAACLEVAEAAAEADDSVAGTQHLLLGLLHVGFAATVLDRLGVTGDRVRERSAALFEPVTRGGLRVVGDGEAEQAVARARQDAARRGQSAVHTQHLLLVLALDPGGAARRVLEGLGVEPARVKQELADMLPPWRREKRTGRRRTRGRVCSFCACTDQGRPMLAGDGVWICDRCAGRAVELLRSGDRALVAH